MVKYYFLDKKNVYQSFYNAPLTFGSFSSKKVVLFAKCFNFLTILVEKTEISGYIWHKSFIQMVKCSSFNRRIVYQSFTGVSLNLSYFFFKGKFCVSACIGKSLPRWYVCGLKRFDLVEKMISLVIFDTNRSFKWKNTLFLKKELFIKVSMGAADV